MVAMPLLLPFRNERTKKTTEATMDIVCSFYEVASSVDVWNLLWR